MVDASDPPQRASGGLVGRVLGDRYRVVGIVSSGANTLIADAVDLQAEEPVTVKLVRPDLAESDEFRTRFRATARAAATLEHPNIASVLDWGEVAADGQSTVFWVVEHLAGGSLRDLLDRGRLLSASQSLVLGLEACRALDAAHQMGALHTELTPSKLVFGTDRRLRIVDFGMARLLGAAAWAEPARVPTHVARYASPEQALGLAPDSKTDVYALALSLLEAVTGSVPFAADSTVATLSARVGKLLPVSADLGSLAAVLERAGRPEAEERSTAAEFGQGLVQAAGSLPRPEPIPALSTGLFDSSELRRPSDPTGGFARPAAAAAAVVAVDAARGDETTEGAEGAEGTESTEIAEPPADPVADEPQAEAPVEAAVADEPADDPVVVPDEVASGPSQADPLLVPLVVPADEVGTDSSEEDPLAADEVASAPSQGEPVENPPAAESTDTEPVVPPPPPPAAEETLAATVPTPPVESPPAPPTDVMPSVVESVPAAPEPASVYDDQRRRPRVGRVLLILVLMVAGIAALSYAGWLLLRTKTHEVPELSGVSESVALAEIEGNDWVVLTERGRNDDFPEPDTVIRTSPVAGVELDEGEQFMMVVSDGPEFRTLPEFNGSSIEESQAAAADLGLIAAEADRRRFSETVPAGNVVTWTVVGSEGLVAEAKILPGETVRLVVSKGPQPRVVPDLQNLTVAEAAKTLDDIQLELQQGKEVFSDTVEAGRVVSQAPASDERVDRGSKVKVRVSKGPDVVPFPDIVGQPFARAERQLDKAGYTVGAVLGTTEGNVTSASIDGSSVDVGELHRRGTAVDIISL